MRTFRDAKAMAKAMRDALAARGHDIQHSEALEIVARQFGLDSWNILSAKIGADALRAPAEPVRFEPPAPIFRIFDEALQKGLVAKNYRYNRPGLERQEWGLECQVIDPFGNRIRFLEVADGA
uniref:glyoxalase superfamily protein n=1 Tax=Mesorhizobium sp. L-8-10 TaxID=2744523 RepID=UPI001927D692|nr:glyoxalase superfamily protein [Mesorhizobium sp. L-8-10]